MSAENLDNKDSDSLQTSKTTITEQERYESINETITTTNDSLDNLKAEISTDEVENLDNLFMLAADKVWVSEDIAHEYLSIIKKFGKIPDDLDDNLKKELWLSCVESEINVVMWCFLFYVKKHCPKNFDKIIPLVNRPTYLNYVMSQELFNWWLLKKIAWYIKIKWDSVYEYLKFCSPFKWSFIENWVLNISKYKDSIEMNWKICMYTQFVENFVEEPESINLFSFLKENPQQLNNLWWKEIKSIDLSINSWINFAFRGILEMVKSRPDINFPQLKEWANETEKQERKQQREKIIKEYENMLREYITKDYNSWNNQTETTDKKWKFDKIFVSYSKGVEEDNMPSINRSQWFSNNNISYSHTSKDISTFILSIEKYLQKHPNSEILVCIEEHGAPNWSSINWWTKEDWIRLANLSPNIKIRSIRCYFWKAFENENIYGNISSLSWFSNTTPTSDAITEALNKSLNKNLCFNEMEIYMRLNYQMAASPLTENMEYINQITWETEIWKVWLAQNDNQNDNSSISYA